MVCEGIVVDLPADHFGVCEPRVQDVDIILLPDAIGVFVRWWKMLAAAGAEDSKAPKTAVSRAKPPFKDITIAPRCFNAYPAPG